MTGTTGQKTDGRAAATLVEVLVAIFVMGIGLLAILALFPLGALRMEQAIQDGRTGNIAQNADAIALVQPPNIGLRNDPLVTNFYINPGAPLPAMQLGKDIPSYPVFVDPLGYRMSAVNPQWVAGIPGSIPRATVTFVQGGNAFQTNYLHLRWFTFLDDMYFDTDGYVQDINFGKAFPRNFQRDIRYTYAYMCQRPRWWDPAVTNMAVVIFNRRPLDLTSQFTLSEYMYQAAFDLSNNVVTISYGNNPKPLLRAGEYILDASIVTTTNPPWMHGYFYRAVSINELPGNALEVEVQTPFRGFPPSPPGNNLQQGRVIILEGVVSVAERGDGRRP